MEDVEAKFELVEWPKEQGEVKKRKTFLALAGADIRSKVGTLADTRADYESLITKLKEDLLRDELLVFLISQAVDLKQDEQEGMDDFAMKTREEILQPNRRSSRIKRSTMDTKYKDYIV